VPQEGIEPPHPAYKTGPLPLRIQGQNWSPMKDSNLRFPRSKQGGIAASPMRDKNGGKGEIRTHTGHRMKVLHNHYATLPYRNTLAGIEPAHPGMSRAVIRYICLA
jgi:hypothetical protein